MKPHTLSKGKTHILYDADVIDHVDESFFDLGLWQQQGAVSGYAQGRGETAFINTPIGEVVMRHYRRGGLPGKFIRDRYLWQGLEATRAWREWRLTARLFELGLPVPRPLAARVVRTGLGYRADLVTLRLQNAEAFSKRLAKDSLDASLWRAIGRCIRRFHEVGLDHADLNAHNILLDDKDTIYLIDFDRGRLRKPGNWAAANLERLQRSFNKLKGLDARFAYDEASWSALMEGYEGPGARGG